MPGTCGEYIDGREVGQFSEHVATNSNLATCTSGGAGHWLLCSLLAVALAFPIVFSVLDHHGSERLPSHGHASPLAELAQAHLHQFERGHIHVSARAPNLVNGVDDVAVRATVSDPWTTLYLFMAVALLALTSALRAPRNLWPRPGCPIRRNERLSPPPTPPPTSCLHTA